MKRGLCQRFAGLGAVFFFNLLLCTRTLSTTSRDDLELSYILTQSYTLPSGISISWNSIHRIVVIIKLLQCFVYHRSKSTVILIIINSSSVCVLHVSKNVNTYVCMYCIQMK